MIERTGRRIGVAVCTYRRPEPLRACLRALAAAELGPLGTCDIALIVVDNAADGSAQVVCREAGLTPPWTLHLIEERRRGIPFARNRALTEGLRLGVDLVALIDDDDLPRPDWLHLLVARQAATGADVVFGRWEPARSIVPPPGLGSMLLKKLRRPDGVVDRFGLPQDASTNNALLTRRLIESMAATSELFSPEFAHTGGSDHDFFIRCHRQGFRLERCPESVVEGVWETKRMTLGGLLKRSFNLGTKQAMLERRHLPAHELSQARRRTIRKLPLIPLRILCRTLGPRNGRSTLAEACDGATLLGRISSYMGHHYQYYR